MKRFWGALCAGFLLAFQGCELGSSPGGGTGAEGVIVDGAGAPVAGARVWLLTAGTGALSKSRSSSPSARTRRAVAESTLTGADGSYRFRELSPGTYNLQAVARVHDTAFSLLERGITLAKGEADLGVDTLRASGSLRVTVRDAQGLPAAGAICALAGSAWRAVSDAQGECLIEGVAPGDYLLEVTQGSLKASGFVSVAGGFESASSVRFTAGAPASAQTWRTYEVEGYYFQGPPNLETSGRSTGLDSWSETYANGDISVTRLGGMIGPSPTPQRSRTSQIRWSDSLQGILTLFLDSTNAIYFAQLSVSKLQQGAWQDWGAHWSGFADDSEGWTQVERILSSVRPTALWKGPLPGVPATVNARARPGALPVGGLLNAVAWNGTVFAAVGSSGAFATSTDGINWVGGATAGKEDLRGIVATPSGFVAVGGDNLGVAVVLRSADGQAWTARAISGAGRMTSVAWGNGRLVAVNYNGVWSSDDGGAEWTAQGQVSSGNMMSVIWTGTQFVMTGYLSGNGHTRLYTSPDGLAWSTRFTGSADSGIGWNTLASSGNRIVATGQPFYGDMGISTDGGLTWTVKYHDTLNIVSLAWAWGRFVGVGSRDGKPAIWTSPDGGSWTRQPLEATAGSQLLGVAGSSSRLVAVGDAVYSAF